MNIKRFIQKLMSDINIAHFCYLKGKLNEN